MDEDVKTFFRSTFPHLCDAGEPREYEFAIAQAAFTSGYALAKDGEKCEKCEKRRETAKDAKKGNGRGRGGGRKFFALFVCLSVVCLAALMNVDVTMAVVGLYALYVGGNVSQKVGMDFAEHVSGGKK